MEGLSLGLQLVSNVSTLYIKHKGTHSTAHFICIQTAQKGGIKWSPRSINAHSNTSKFESISNTARRMKKL